MFSWRWRRTGAVERSGVLHIVRCSSRLSTPVGIARRPDGAHERIDILQRAQIARPPDHLRYRLRREPPLGRGTEPRDDVRMRGRPDRLRALAQHVARLELDLHEGMVPQVSNGFCALPDRPGLGTVLNEKVAASRPYVPLTRSGESRAF